MRQKTEQKGSTLNIFPQQSSEKVSNNFPLKTVTFNYQAECVHDGPLSDLSYNDSMHKGLAHCFTTHLINKTETGDRSSQIILFVV